MAAIPQEFVYDEQQLSDKIAELEASLEQERAKRDKVGSKLAIAQENYDQSVEEMEENKADLHLTNISGLEGNRSARQKTLDLLESDDLFALRDRLLELKLLDKDLSTNISDARVSAVHWRKDAEDLEKVLEEKTNSINEVPSHESDSVLEAQTKALRAKEEQRKMELKIQDLEAELKKKKMNDAIEIEQVEMKLATLTREVHVVQKDGRTLDRKLQGMTTQIECLHESREHARKHLKPFLGNDELLRVSFNRYDKSGDQELDKEEVFNCMKELQRVDQNAPEVSMEEVEQYIATVDKDGSGTIDFEEFRACFLRLVQSPREEENKKK
jgi:chromosome segregation ATPase|eukprot:g2724.t1